MFEITVSTYFNANLSLFSHHVAMLSATTSTTMGCQRPDATSTDAHALALYPSILPVVTKFSRHATGKQTAVGRFFILITMVGLSVPYALYTYLCFST